MRYYVLFDKTGRLKSHMEYPHLNATMKEVSETEYKKILKESGISYTATEISA